MFLYQLIWQMYFELYIEFWDACPSMRLLKMKEIPQSMQLTIYQFITVSDFICMRNLDFTRQPGYSRHTVSKTTHTNLNKTALSYNMSNCKVSAKVMLSSADSLHVCFMVNFATVWCNDTLWRPVHGQNTWKRPSNVLMWASACVSFSI